VTFGVAVTITHLVAFEVLGVTVPSLARLFVRVGILAVITIIWVIVVVDMTIEVLGTMEPRTCSDEDAAGEPFGTVVPIGGTAVGRNIVIAIGACGRYADAYRYLCF